MIPLEEFKQSLSPKLQQMSDDQIRQLRDDLDQIADCIFDSWRDEVNKTGYLSSISDNVKDT